MKDDFFIEGNNFSQECIGCCDPLSFAIFRTVS